MRRLLVGALSGGLLLAPLPAAASEILLAGVLGSRAVLVVDGGRPQTITVGESTREGIRLLSLVTDGATVEVQGRVERLRLGAGPIRIADHSPSAQASELRLVPDGRGHYAVQGAIGAVSLRFLIDTGATFVSISAADAQRSGLRLQDGRQVLMHTANGTVPARLVRVPQLRLGGIVLHDVEASVLESELPVPLLGMSALNRLDMRRESGLLILQKRY